MSDTLRDQVGRRFRVLCLIGVTIVLSLYIVGVLWPPGRLLDDLVLLGRPRHDPEELAAARDVLGSLSLVTLVVVALSIGALAMTQGRPRLALVLLVAIGGATLTTEILKRWLPHPPMLLPDLGAKVVDSFPSGHVTVASVLCDAFVLVLPARRRVIGAVLGGGYVLFVATSVLVAGWHRLADVVAGAAVSLAWVAGAAALLVHLRGVARGSAARMTEGISGSLMVSTGAVLLIIGSAVFLARSWDLVGSASLLDRGTAQGIRLFAGAITAASGTAILAAGLVLSAVRGVILDPSSSEAAVPDPGPTAAS